MYGDLIQVSGDLTARATWRRVPLASAGDESSIDEFTLQRILFHNPDILPLGEIDDAYRNPVPVCMELGTQAGPADAVYLTPTGRIVLAEFKLWRNPEARREVVAQILDYARVLASWSYDDFDREVRKREKRSPFDIVSEAREGLEEQRFVDNVRRRLRRGEFLLLIVGDGIREDVQDIVAYVQEHSGLRFNLALIEAALFRRGDGEDLIIQPRVLARTELLPRTILLRKTILDETDDDPVLEHEPRPVEEENERFWKAVLEDFAFDDPVPVVPQPSGSATVLIKVEGSGFNDWGLSFGASLNRTQSHVETYLGRRKGLPEAERVFREIIDTESENALEAEPGAYKRWESNGRPRLGFRCRTEFDGATIRDFDEAVEWMREHFNRLVTALHPECRRRLRQG